MNLRLPLYGKILGWFLLNLLFLAGAFWIVAVMQFKPEGWLAVLAGDRSQRVAESITWELRDRPRTNWNPLLQRYSELYGVTFLVRSDDGAPVAGPALELPVEVLSHLRRRNPGAQPRRPDGPPAFNDFSGRREEGRMRRLEGGPPEDRLEGRMRMPGPERAGGPERLFLVSNSPRRYWGLFRFPGRDEQMGRPMPMRLVILSTTLGGNGLFVDWKPWLWTGCAVLVLSALWWAPFVHGITRSVKQMKHAAERLAGGQFDVTLETKRRDELGQLGEGINQLASRLQGFITGQKRFLGDIAHELCAPIARLQMSLGVLEHKTDPSQREQINDLREELDEMSALVNELLSFSKAGLRGRETALEPVSLVQIVRRAAKKEDISPERLRIEIPPDLCAMAEPELLGRAVGNILRNAERYANTGVISVSGEENGANILLSIADEGPGVPAEALPKLFDPFYRLDPSRTRETGGAGLGLAIVKSCVEACQGTVQASNRQPRGLQVDLRLRKAAS